MGIKKISSVSWIIGAIIVVVAVFAGVTATSLIQPAGAVEITVYKSPSCGCCSSWVDHMRANGYSMKTVEIDDLEKIKKMAGVPDHLQSCHTAFVGEYVLEGHVPAADVARLLAEGPVAIGLAVGGMPSGAPGMEDGDVEPFDVTLFRAIGPDSVYRKY